MMLAGAIGAAAGLGILAWFLLHWILLELGRRLGVDSKPDRG